VLARSKRSAGGEGEGVRKHGKGTGSTFEMGHREGSREIQVRGVREPVDHTNIENGKGERKQLGILSGGTLEIQ